MSTVERITFEDLGPETPQPLFESVICAKWSLFFDCPHTTMAEKKGGTVIVKTGFNAVTAKFSYAEIGTDNLTAEVDGNGDLDITVDDYTPSYKLILHKDTGVITIKTIDTEATGTTIITVSRAA